MSRKKAAMARDGLTGEAGRTDTHIHDGYWDLRIRPKRSLISVDLREVWRYRDLVTLFVRRDIVARFKQTLLGPLWFVIGPLLSMIVYTFVFHGIAGISTDKVPPPLFYLTGIVGWTYFASCLNGTSNTFTSNAHIFGKVYFPRLVTPVSVTISNLMLFIIQFTLLIILVGFYYMRSFRITPNLTVLLIPLYLVILASIGMGIGILISALTTKYRDLTQLMGFGTQLWLYATPIIYPMSSVPAKYAAVVQLNPVAPIIENFKYAILGSGRFQEQGLIYSIAFALCSLIVGALVFNKVEQTFMDTV